MTNRIAPSRLVLLTQFVIEGYEFQRIEAEYSSPLSQRKEFFAVPQSLRSSSKAAISKLRQANRISS
ncbi:MAG: hypothetical protein IPI21_18080 [Propionivibrio sp.]|nr:hypothetical protein [Propionivibrio sp.]